MVLFSIFTAYFNQVLESPDAAYSLFMKAQDVYTMAPSSGMVATFDLTMNVFFFLSCSTVFRILRVTLIFVTLRFLG